MEKINTGKLRLPPDFVLRSRYLLGDGYESFEAALCGDATVSLRVNGDKCGLRPVGDRVAWCETGYYLPERIPFTFDPMFHAGAYYVQEASSMFLEQAVKACVATPVRCLDLCAAPGGKSTHLSAILPEGSLLVSNEAIRGRAHILVENLTKWGLPNVITTCNDPAAIGRLTGFFDLILADVPCSGEGMFRKDPSSADEWSRANVLLCAARQRRIVRDAWNALKPGGILIYSTCTYNTEENEDNIHYIVSELGAEAMPVPAAGKWHVEGAMRYGYPVYRFLPHRARGEGFFLAALRKTSGEAHARPGMPARDKDRARGSSAPFAVPAQARDYLLEPEKFHIGRRGNMVEAIPVANAADYRYLSQKLDVLASGISLGEIKGNDLLPSHSLAMSVCLNAAAFAAREVDQEEAVRYLRKETLACDGERGYALVRFRAMPLGFVKALGNRSNNLYPPQWRIRSQRNNCSTTLMSPSLGAGSSPSARDIIR